MQKLQGNSHTTVGLPLTKHLYVKVESVSHVMVNVSFDFVTASEGKLGKNVRIRYRIAWSDHDMCYKAQ